MMMCCIQKIVFSLLTLMTSHTFLVVAGEKPISNFAFPSVPPSSMWLAYFMPGLVLYMDGLKVGSNTGQQKLCCYFQDLKNLLWLRNQNIYLLTSQKNIMFASVLSLNNGIHLKVLREKQWHFQPKLFLVARNENK